ncbi:Membrane-associated enzyme, PAP2 (acid phosphatase) superfamily [Allopseudospirillum japonicum]|uniref:Membrane-associated enzyme, PAP2 (Acid phosphatase) superfamily n=1 Tax=Allopseudospirillum japonicum TaxID=64971 RepID=A0A1H6SKX9_9GAMM|nr:phosphatase PAP2 family protein [Allopseudospirillum japonicum]SEI68588.1 Membrane-associated enzyme, PAP2 (acid phosphatase) superfamily [Allopseudospirillum japonicum]
MSFYRVLIPVFLLLGASAASTSLGIDEALAHYFFDQTTGVWPWRHAWLTSELLHQDARYFFMTVYGLLIMMAAYYYYKHPQHPNRNIMNYLLITLVTSLVSVSLLKKVTHLPCPWDVATFGGRWPETPAWWQMFSQQYPKGYCFPAGHASSGWASLGLYFIAPYYSKKIRWCFYLSVPFVSLILGFAQQMRGAHFLSHDLATCALCYAIAAITAYFYPPVSSITTSLR